MMMSQHAISVSFRSLFPVFLSRFRVLRKFLLSLGAALAISMGVIAHAQEPEVAPAVAAEPAVAAAAATVAAAEPEPVAAAETTAEETAAVGNPYGLDALWRQGDLVARGTLVILLLLSVASWYVIVTKLHEQHRLFRHAKEARRKFWAAPGVQQGAEALNPQGAFRFIAQSGLEAKAHHVGLLEHIDLNTWIGQSIQRAVENVQNRLQDGLALLATVGSTSPFIGLFGTVWGIYHALTAIGIAGQASIDKVAGPVGEALIMTAIGLAVAVPAVLGYNWLVRRNKAALDEVRAFGADLHATLLGGETSRTAAARLSIARG
ncbi:MAG: MotA/TolQ/ExbB proton channel family protein [Zoogloeaceae bacterium]|jgi:biopolymer transport protein ExbB|nr:MotA/TolQ/ExbB proton channel family protein [Zoogloeaceae bacterium]